MRERILIAEDSATQREALVALLGEQGFQVTAASDGQQAFARAREGSFDLVITDVLMPGMDGFELCQRLKSELRADCPAIMLLTGLTDATDIIRGLESGADNFLTKPYEADQLISRVQFVIANRRLRQKARAELGVVIQFLGKTFTITSERQQILDLLLTTYEDAVLQNRRLREREEELRIAKAELDRYAGALEQRLKSVLETIPDVLFSVDASLDNVLYVSPAAGRVFGYTPDELLADPQLWWRGVHPDDLAHVQNTFCAAAESGSAQTVECRFEHRDGGVRWIQLDVAAVLDASRGRTRLDGVAYDITRRKNAEEHLQRSEADYRGLVEHAPLGIYRSTSDGRLLTVNRALVEMLGYASADEVLALSLAQDVYADPEQRAELVARFRDEGEARTEAQWKRMDGSLITVQLNVRIMRSPTKEIEYFEGLVEDVTQQRSLELQFRQAQRLEAVGRLAAGVAHDFNNILTVIVSNSEFLLGDLGTDDPKRQDVEEIRAAAQRATGLTRQLLAFSRRQVLQLRVLSLNEVVDTLNKMLRRMIGEDVTLESSLDPELGAVRADAGQLEQVILNLVVNSRDAMPGGGRLTIETANVDLDEAYVREHGGASPGRYVMLAVSDTGVGMDAETRAHIFEPFFTTKELGKGTGLGLATVYGIVKQSRGNIWVYSEPGRGTTFKIYLPRVDAPLDAPELGQAGQPSPGGHELVLLAEDEASVRRVAAEALEKKGYRVLVAPDGQTALEMARAQPGEIQLLITDLVMPGMTGRELAETLAAERPHIRVLYMSGYTDDAVVRHGVLEAGMLYLQKPFTPGAIAFKVREALDRPASA